MSVEKCWLDTAVSSRLIQRMSRHATVFVVVEGFLYAAHDHLDHIATVWFCVYHISMPNVSSLGVPMGRGVVLVAPCVVVVELLHLLKPFRLVSEAHKLDTNVARLVMSVPHSLDKMVDW